MELTKQINGNVVTISVKGRIDTTNAQEFETAIISEVKKDVKTVVDFSGIEYISSAGLRALLASHKLSLKEGGTFVLSNINDEVMEVLDITGFSSILTIED